ncbi:MAG: rRNA maturation RNase YbeY [Candidatus Omnitrophica bacterium]|nr:rRNA maturation RNase YbeY [Candidatus Omnitrophota bacterium]
MPLKEKTCFLEKYIPSDIKEISVILISDKKITDINRKFLHKNHPTDVLSFKTSQTGDIIISAETAKMQAKEFKHSLEKEIFYLIIHGILHFSGYKDYSDRDRNKMLKKQDAILKKVWAGR